MCLAVPLEITELKPPGKALARRGGGSIEIDVSLLESPRVGDFVLVHAGFAIETLDEGEASETLRLLGGSSDAPGAGG